MQQQGPGHNDIKASNIMVLLDSDCKVVRVMLIDLGCSTEYHGKLRTHWRHRCWLQDPVSFAVLTMCIAIAESSVQSIAHTLRCTTLHVGIKFIRGAMLSFAAKLTNALPGLCLAEACVTVAATFAA